MKKLISLVLLAAMLLTVTVAMTVGASAAESRIAPYTATSPIVDADCTKDEVYEKATAYAIGSRGNVQMLWNENGLYFYFDVYGQFLDVYLSGSSFAAADANTAWGTDGDYYFKVKPDGTLENTDFSSVFGAKRVPENMQLKSKIDRTTEDSDLVGFDVEIFIPMTANDWTLNAEGNSEIAFGAMVDNNWQVTGFATGGTPRLNALQKVTLQSQSGDAVMDPEEAAALENALTASYASSLPTIDGTIDPIWETTEKIGFRGEGNEDCYMKILWTKEGVYYLAVVPAAHTSLSVAVTEVKWEKEGESSYYWWDGAGYGFRVTKQENGSFKTETQLWFTTGTATGFQAESVAYEDGFIVEAYAPRKSTKKDTVGEFQNLHKLGFGAFLDGDVVNRTEQCENTFARGDHFSDDLSGVIMMGKACAEHVWGISANCQSARRCSKCLIYDTSGTSASDNHVGEKVFVDNGDGTHTEKWDCCNKVVSTGDHTYGEVTTDHEATCTEAGSKAEFCTVCGSRHEVETIAALGHDYDTTGELVIDKEATCTEAGSKSHHCRREGCDAKTDVEEIPALGHVEGQWKVSTAATCSKKGEEYCTCSRCWEAYQQRELPMLSHTATEWIVDQEAAAGVAGKKHQQCTVCGALFNETVIEALPEEKGCKSSVSVSAIGIGMLAAAAVGVTRRKKKKED